MDKQTEVDIRIKTEVDTRINEGDILLARILSKIGFNIDISLVFEERVQELRNREKERATQWYNQRSCTCINPGEDDGDHTCPIHHDCTRGDCTHWE